MPPGIFPGIRSYLASAAAYAAAAVPNRPDENICALCHADPRRKLGEKEGRKKRREKAEGSVKGKQKQASRENRRNHRGKAEETIEGKQKQASRETKRQRQEKVEGSVEG